MSDLTSFLKQADIFYQLTPTQLEMVANVCQEHTYALGETILEEGTNSKDLYVITHGEVALVDEGLRSATVRSAQKDTILLILPRDKVIMLCETYPQLGYRLMYNLAADLAMKIRNTDLQIRETLLYGKKAQA